MLVLRLQYIVNSASDKGVGSINHAVDDRLGCDRRMYGELDQIAIVFFDRGWSKVLIQYCHHQFLHVPISLFYHVASGPHPKAG